MEDREISLKEKIAEEITRFGADQMRAKPEGVRIEIAQDEVVVTMRGVVCRAEKELARDLASRTLLDQFHHEVFEAVKDSLERAVADIMGRGVVDSSLAVNSESGAGIIVFSLAPAGGGGSVDGIEKGNDL